MADFEDRRSKDNRAHGTSLPHSIKPTLADTVFVYRENSFWQKLADDLGERANLWNSGERVILRSYVAPVYNSPLESHRGPIAEFLSSASGVVVCDKTLWEYCSTATSQPIVLFDAAMSETLRLPSFRFPFQNTYVPNTTRTGILKYKAELVRAENREPIIVLNHMTDYVMNDDAKCTYIADIIATGLPCIEFADGLLGANLNTGELNKLLDEYCEQRQLPRDRITILYHHHLVHDLHGSPEAIFNDVQSERSCHCHNPGMGEVFDSTYNILFANIMKLLPE